MWCWHCSMSDERQQHLRSLLKYACVNNWNNTQYIPVIELEKQNSWMFHGHSEITFRYGFLILRTSDLVCGYIKYILSWDFYHLGHIKQIIRYNWYNDVFHDIEWVSLIFSFAHRWPRVCVYIKYILSWDFYDHGQIANYNIQLIQGRIPWQLSDFLFSFVGYLCLIPKYIYLVNYKEKKA